MVLVVSLPSGAASNSGTGTVCGPSWGGTLPQLPVDPPPSPCV